jgi:hypothetical protein
MGWTVEEHQRNVHSIQFPISAKRDQHVLLLSDGHVDSVCCQRKKMIQHLDEADDREAIVILGGDLFDAMQGKGDKRANLQELRSEYAGKWTSYFQSIVDDAAEIFNPYRNMIALYTLGNHETSALRNKDWNIAQSFVDRLRINGARRIHLGGFGGYVHFRASLSGTNGHSRTMYYYHGHGGSGGGPTKGISLCSRLAERAHANIYWTGHIHTSWEHRHARDRLTKSMTIATEDLQFICTPGYKDGWRSGYMGFEAEKFHGPKPTGAYWLRFYKEKQRRDAINFDVRQAK